MRAGWYALQLVCQFVVQKSDRTESVDPAHLQSDGVRPNDQHATSVPKIPLTLNLTLLTIY